MKYVIAVAGVTGNVGLEILNILDGEYGGCYFSIFK